MGSLKLAMMVVFKLWAPTTNQGFFPRESAVKYLPTHHWLHFKYLLIVIVIIISFYDELSTMNELCIAGQLTASGFVFKASMSS